MTVKTYSPDLVVTTFGGYTLKEWDDIRIIQTAPKFRQIRGIRGKNTRVRNPDTSAIVEIDVPITSEINYIFGELVRLDMETGNARLSLTIKDVAGYEVFSSSQAYVESLPERSYSKASTSRTWRIICEVSEFQSSGEGWSVNSLF